MLAHQKKRLMTIGGFMTFIIMGLFLLLSVLRENVQLFYNPSEIVNLSPSNDIIKIGGLVVENSIRHEDQLITHFEIKDFEGTSPVIIKASYQGVLPDLFREGQGVVITGVLIHKAQVKASQVLAKHDENYRPKI